METEDRIRRHKEKVEEAERERYVDHGNRRVDCNYMATHFRQDILSTSETFSTDRIFAGLNASKNPIG